MTFWRSTYVPPSGADRLQKFGDYEATRFRFYELRHANLRFLVRERYEWMSQYLDGRQHLVELGAGPGLSREFLHQPGLELTDVVERQWLDRTVDAMDLPYSTASLDAVICSHMIHHAEQPVAVMEEICRVLKPGGVLLVNETTTSALHRLIMWGMRHEGWSYDIDLFDKHESAKTGADPLDGNNAVAEMLFGDRRRFVAAFPELSVEHDQLSECFVFLVSGGVGGQAFTVEMPCSLLRAIRELDRFLIFLCPRVFALARRMVIRKNL